MQLRSSVLLECCQQLRSHNFAEQQMHAVSHQFAKCIVATVWQAGQEDVYNRRSAMPDLDVTFCLQAQNEVHQERAAKAAQQHIMILLHSCGNVFEQARQRGDEVCVIVRVACIPT